MDTLSNWQNTTKEQRQEVLKKVIEGHNKSLAYEFINLVSAGHYGVYASLGPNFAYAIFGRDSLEVAEHLLKSHQQLVRNIIFTLARLQGVTYDNISEEEPGKIHHEYRSRIFDGEVISEASLAVMNKLQHWWGAIGSDELVYYGSYDATPMYIKLVCRYAEVYGSDILGETYIARNGHSRTIHDCLDQAAIWLNAKITGSDWQLLEYKRVNPSGILNQVWKDSNTAYLHLDGSIANAEAGLASIELQAYAYDALICMAHYANPQKAKAYLAAAKGIQTSTLHLMWMPDSQFFAQGLDRDNNQKTRQIKTLTSNVGLLLQSGLLKDLPNNQKSLYVKAIVKTILGADFLTEAGIRCRSLAHKDMPGFVDYHGSYAVWPKETFDIAQGLTEQGFLALARQLEIRILRSVASSGDFYELFYVEDDGQAWLDHTSSVEHFSHKSPGHHLSIPEPGQAWAISAFMNIVINNKVKNINPTKFENEIIKAIPNYCL